MRPRALLTVLAAGGALLVPAAAAHAAVTSVSPANGVVLPMGTGSLGSGPRFASTPLKISMSGPGSPLSGAELLMNATGAVGADGALVRDGSLATVSFISDVYAGDHVHRLRHLQPARRLLGVLVRTLLPAAIQPIAA